MLLVPGTIFCGLFGVILTKVAYSMQVKSGMLQSPGMPAAGFKPLLEGIVDMYGKTVHTWQVGVAESVPSMSSVPFCN